MSRIINQSISISVSTNQVFNALITPSSIKEWWGAKSAIIIPKVNGIYAVTWGPNSDKPTYITYSNITDIVSNTYLELEYKDYFSISGSLPFEATFNVKFTISTKDDLTILEVIQEGFPDTRNADEYFEGCKTGWNQVLQNIKSCLEETKEKYRDQGAKGALLDEYERALNELSETISDVSPTELIAIVDHKTDDEDCRSIQTILNHVINAGYTYTYNLENHISKSTGRISIEQQSTVTEYQKELSKMFKVFENLLKQFPEMLEGDDSGDTFTVSWGPVYDIEQLIEHAIVHVMRHRRQIERFLLKLEIKNR